MKRILVYSHDTFGLGNIRRMLEISRHLVDSDPGVSVLIITGSPMLHAFRIPPRIDYVKLPCLSRNAMGSYGARFLDMDLQSTVRLRANLISSTIADFCPDLILVDKKPFGVENELADVLEALPVGVTRPRVVLLLRDILDDDLDSRHVIVDSHKRQRVNGSGWDLGMRWSLPGRARPTVWLGWASGSGDGSADDGVDRAFRQTGLQENKARFGGVKRFRYYGELLRPELSNLVVGSVGASLRFLENSSADLVLHSYRQRHASTRIQDNRLDHDPTGNSRDLGRELDLIFSFRESRAVEFSATLSEQGAHLAQRAVKRRITSSWG